MKKPKVAVGSLEGKLLFILLALLACVLVAGWGAAMRLRQTVAANADVVNVDSSALIEVERLRNLSESLISNSRTYFLLGSKAVFDKQEVEKTTFADSLTKFAQASDSPDIHSSVKEIEAAIAQEKEIFEQAMKYRSEQTESKIVGQFYQSKTIPLLKEIDKNFDKIVKVHNAEIDEARAKAREAGLNAQAQVPQLMTWFTAAVAGLSLCLALLVIRMLYVRRSFLRERDRLYNEAKNAVLARDEVIAAVSRDFREPLQTLNELADGIEKTLPQFADDVRFAAAEIQSIADDIRDQKKADMGTLSLRLEQLDIAEVLEDAQMMMQPLAKKRDVKLHFDSFNQSNLAYFDRERVMRVLHNVIGNAIKFSQRHGRVAIKVKADAEFVNISIADNGTGIPESQKSTLFESYWQAGKTAEQGAGVGLGVAKTIVEAHGGSIRVDNTLGAGSTFTFSLPRRRPVNAPFKKPSSVKRVTRAASPGSEATL